MQETTCLVQLPSPIVQHFFLLGNDFFLPYPVSRRASGITCCLECRLFLVKRDLCDKTRILKVDSYGDTFRELTRLSDLTILDSILGRADSIWTRKKKSASHLYLGLLILYPIYGRGHWPQLCLHAKLSITCR